MDPYRVPGRIRGWPFRTPNLGILRHRPGGPLSPQQVNDVRFLQAVWGVGRVGVWGGGGGGGVPISHFLRQLTHGDKT